MRINNNISALNAWRGLTNTDNSLSKSLEKLSSGLRINRAADDAAGLAISEKMRGQIRGLNQAVRNAQDGISLIQTAEGALNETHAILQRMRELIVQSQNDTNTDEDRNELDREFQQLKTELTGITTRTEFNTLKLLNGSLSAELDLTNGDGLIRDNGISDIKLTGAALGEYKLEVTVDSGTGEAAVALTKLDPGGDSDKDVKVEQKVKVPVDALETTEVNFGSLGIRLSINSDLADTTTGNSFEVIAPKDSKGNDLLGALTLQVGANHGQTMTLQINPMDAESLGLGDLTIGTKVGADAAFLEIDKAVADVSGLRAQLGAYQNRLEHTIKNLGVAAENLSAAESRIRDVDMAAEMMNFTKQNILMQAGTAMLAQANARPQSVLQLLG